MYSHNGDCTFRTLQVEIKDKCHTKISWNLLPYTFFLSDRKFVGDNTSLLVLSYFTGIHTLLETAFTISMHSNGIAHCWTETDKTVIKELTQTIVSKSSQASAVSWMDRTCPELLNAMHLFFLANLYRGKEEVSTNHRYTREIPGLVYHSV